MAEMSSKDIKNEEEVLKNIKDEKGSPKYVVPNFVKRSDLGALIHDTEFSIGDDILEKKGEEAKLLRVLLVKPIEGLMASGYPIKKIIEEYKINNPAKQLLVIREDMSNMPGSISMLESKDSKRAHGGTDSINSVCGITDYVRFLIGIGKPTGNLSNGQFVSNAFEPANKEMDMLGFSLDLTAQALQYYAAYGDFKKTKKKYASNKKLPNNLRKMEGLVFPTTILDPLQVKELEVEKRAEGKKAKAEGEGAAKAVQPNAIEPPKSPKKNDKNVAKEEAKPDILPKKSEAKGDKNGKADKKKPTSEK